MSLPYSDPANPALPSPLFSDLTAARGDHLRANNNAIFNDLTYLDDLIAALDDAIPPVGTIIARLSGYFSNGSNGGFVPIESSPSWRWQKCDGREFYDVRSPWFNQIGRYLPLLTDDRFLMGSNTPGQIGGANSFTITTANLPPHSHSISHDHGTHSHNGSTGTESATHNHYAGIAISGLSCIYGSASPGAGSSTSHSGSDSGAYATTAVTSTENQTHTHNFTTNSVGMSHSGSSGDGGFPNNVIDNRPKYLSVEYYMRVA